MARPKPTMNGTRKDLASFLEDSVLVNDNWCEEWNMGISDQELLKAFDLLSKMIGSPDDQPAGASEQKTETVLNVDPGEQATFEELCDLLS